MKAEIQQVLKMNKEGTITDEQATELLAELARKEAENERGGGGEEADRPGAEGAQADRDESERADARRRDAGSWDHVGLMDTIFSKVNTTVKHAMDGAFGWDHGAGAGGYQGETYGSQAGRNSIHMSKFDFPEGKDYVFTGNAVRMSSVKDVRLDRAEMLDNVIDMSKVCDISIKDGKVIGCGIRASSVEDWSVDGATLRAAEISGSKVSDFHCGSGSVIRGVRVQGTSMKDFRLVENSKAADVVINATAVADMNVLRTSIAASEIHGSHIVGLSLQDCDARNLMLRMMSVRHTAFTGCTLIDTVFTGGEKWAWKKQGFKDVRFENCRLEKVLFANCRLVDVSLRNITLKDRQFRDLDLSGRIIDGNEALLLAAGLSA